MSSERTAEISTVDGISVCKISQSKNYKQNHSLPFTLQSVNPLNYCKVKHNHVMNSAKHVIRITEIS